MAQTRPTGEQLRFRSENTGDHILDTYMEASEKGGRAVYDLLDDLFDSETGNFATDNFQFRFDSETDEIQVRVGVFAGQDTGWQNVTPLFSQRGTFSPNTEYRNLDVVVVSTKDVYIVHGLAKDATETFTSENAFIDSTNTQRIVDVSEARDWASKTDGQVDSTDYSAKAYAVGGQGVDGSIGSAKDWAIKTDDTVDGNNYSAKYWATSTDVTTVSSNINAVTTVSNDISNVNTVATNISNVNTAADDITNINSVAAELGVGKDVTIVATDLEGTDTVGTVSGSIANVNTVASSISNVNTVSSYVGAGKDITVVAAQINNNNLQAVADDIQKIIDVANDLNETVSEIDLVAGSIANVDTVGNSIANVNTVAGINADVTTVAGISANTTTVAGISADVSTVAGISSDITSVATIDANVTTVAGIDANVTTVAGIASDVTAVADNNTDVSTVATDITKVSDVADALASPLSAASGVSYDNTESGFEATDLQAAVDEVDAIQKAAYALEDRRFRFEYARANNLPVVPTLLLDPPRDNQLDPRVNFSRGSSGTYFDEFGILRTAAPNEPRIDHDPVTGEVKGLLLEEQRTNLVHNSSNLHLFPNRHDDTATVENYAIAPNGQQEATLVTWNEDRRLRSNVISLEAGKKYTFSVFVKDVDSGSTQIGATGLSAGVLSFDFSTGQMQSADEKWSDGRAEYVGNGWYRISGVYTAPYTWTDLFGFWHNAPRPSSILAWGAQLEEASYPTSYIKTEGSQVTRAADVAKVDGTNLDSIYNADAGTLYVEGDFREGEQVVDLGTADLYEFSGSNGKLGITYDSENTTSELALKTAGLFEKLQYWPRRLAQGTLDTLLGYTQDQAPLLQAYSGAAAAYSLRSLNGSEFNPVVRVRRSLDNAEQDFTAKAIENGTLEAFVNEIPTTKPADYGSGAAAAYSLRVVSDSYSGPVVKVRRSSDNAEQDFTAAEIDDASLLTWVGTGGTDNGFVTTWYDQSGNSNDATQSTAASQPKIVDAGVLVTENGKAAIDFSPNGGGFELFTSFSGSIVTSSFGFYTVLKTTSANSNPVFGWQDPNVFAFWGYINLPEGAGTRVFWKNVGIVQETDSGNISSQHFLYSLNYNDVLGEIDIFRNNQLAVNNQISNSNDRVSGNFVIGSSGNGNNSGNSFQEIIIYPSDQSSNRTLIESEINDYYGIYTPTSDGFVTTWYDQSGNDNHATQTTAANQPKIVDAGSLVTENGKAALQFDGVDDDLVGPALIASIKDAYASVVFSYEENGGAGFILKLSSFNLSARFYVTANDFNINAAGAFDFSYAVDTQYIATLLSGDGDYAAYVNGEETAYSGTHSVDTVSGTSTEIGSFLSNPGQFLLGKIQEVVVYPSDQSANREAIEQNINNHYGIY